MESSMHYYEDYLESKCVGGGFARIIFMDFLVTYGPLSSPLRLLEFSV